jgi:PEP-CTERM motif
MKAAVKMPLAAIGILSAIGLSSAQAAVIDFEGLGGSGAVDRASPYTEDGFVLDYLGVLFSFRSIHSGHGSFTGSVSFLNNGTNDITRLTKSGGGAFDLASIDLDSLTRAVNVTVTFIGTLLNSTTVTQSFTTDATFPALQTFEFGDAFNSVTQVEWVQVFPFHQFDNIVVNAPDAGQVPEPMTLTLLGAGLAGMGAMRRRIAK